MNQSYVNPPVVEALCEFEFVADTPLDITAIGLFYDKIKLEFPIKQQQMAVAPRPEKDAFGLHMLLRGQFFRPDRSAAIGTSPEILTVSQLKPYKTWPDFRSLILSNYQIFKDIISPKGFKRVSLRYINRFEFVESTAEHLEDYFNFHPTVPPDLPQIFAAVNDRVEMSCNNGRGRLGIALHTVPEKTEGLSFILDLGYQTASPEIAEGVALDSIDEWIETAHDRIEEAFEKCITNECRTHFGGVK